MSDQKETKKSTAGTVKKGVESAPAKAVLKGGGGISRRTAYIILILAASFAILVWRQYGLPDVSPGRVTNVTSTGKPKIGGAFTLVDQNGKTVTQADFKGRYMLIYFGYTFCPDVCPTSLSTIASALDMIGDEAANVIPIFITVDPERDTPEQMKMYVSYFSPKMVGLTGSVAQVSAAAEAYKAYFAKAGDADGAADEYLMDHSSITYLMGPDGEFVSHFSHGVEAEEMAKRLRELL